MVSVTEKARDEMKRLLEESVNNSLIGFRLGFTDDVYTLHTDVEKPGDQIIKHGRTKILLIGKEFENDLDDVTIDFEKKKKFVLSRGPLTGFNSHSIKLK